MSDEPKVRLTVDQRQKMLIMAYANLSLVSDSLDSSGAPCEICRRWHATTEAESKVWFELGRMEGPLALLLTTGGIYERAIGAIKPSELESAVAALAQTIEQDDVER